MIIVPYAHGAASPHRIAGAAAPFGGAVFVVDPTEPLPPTVLSLLGQLGPVVSGSQGDAALLTELERYRPRGVVAFVDVLLPLASWIGAHFELPCHTAATCAFLTSKAVQRRRLNEQGAGHVSTTSFSFEGELPAHLAESVYPVVLKPDAGASSRDTFYLESFADLRAHTGDLVAGRRYVLEEAIVGAGRLPGSWLADYLSVEHALADGEARCLGMTGRLPLAPPVRERGLVHPLTLDGDLGAEVRELALRAVRALGVTTGLTHTEIKVTPKGPQVIEVNGRLGGSLERLVPRAGVADVVSLAVEIAAGAKAARVAELIRPAEQVAMVRWVQPPMAATAVEGITGLADLRRMPGVFGAGRVLAPGSAVDWRRGSIGRVVDVWLEAADLDELAHRSAAVERHIDRHITWRYA
ncbi:hypothetical protein ABZ366_14160 [Streptomyces sp. NPDC005904]|uniref:hypothetical protein n=1 Tax=Streptomyces sp. NPDC005904 TaxID=3154570 RepID=UPI0033E041EE